MKKIQYSRYGGPEELRLDEVALPDPGKGQVRVRVQAASVNPMDWKIRRGEMKMLSGFRFPRGLGHDFAGIIDAVGPDVRGFAAGDAVIGVTSIPKAGAMADYVVAEAENLWIKPASVPFVEAAALTVVGLTAWTALVAKAKLRAGQAVFINGCLGAVGRSAVQIARMRGASVVGSCGAAGLEEARALGVDEAVDYRALDLHSFERRFDVVFDTAGALSLRQCGAMLKHGGMSLHIVPNLAKWIGSLVSRRHHLVFGNPTPQSLAGIAEAAGRGILVPAIGRTVPLSGAIPAIAEYERTGSPKGKLVIVPE
jgi:NADPH:quinone reductase-like Zn-dependent oxidoreductase